MKQIEQVAEDIYRVISEPGDVTRYEYLAYDDAGTFHFCGTRSMMHYPRTLDYWEVKSADKEKLLKIAEAQDCNVYTIAECARTVIQIVSNERREEPWPTFGLQYQSLLH